MAAALHIYTANSGIVSKIINKPPSPSNHIDFPIAFMFLHFVTHAQTTVLLKHTYIPQITISMHRTNTPDK